MKPRVRFLEDELVDRIVAEATTVLTEIEVELEDDEAKALLTGHGARRMRIPEDLVEGAIAAPPSSFRLFDVMGDETRDFSGAATYFTPASSAIMILDETTGKVRTPTTAGECGMDGLPDRDS